MKGFFEMADSNDNDLDTKVQGKQGVHIKKVFEASKRLGLLDTNPLSMENKAAILAEAGLPLNGNLSTAYVYREHGRHIEAVVGLDKFIASDWNFTRHPQAFAKLCHYQPGWARLAFADKYDRSDKYPGKNINRMRYEYLLDLANIAKDGVTEEAMDSGALARG